MSSGHGTIIVVLIKSTRAGRGEMTSFEESFAAIQRDEEMKALRLENARLRQVISCATCPICGEEIAVREWTIDAKERLIHAPCEDEPE